MLLLIFLAAASAFAFYRHRKAGLPELVQVEWDDWKGVSLPLVYSEVESHPVNVLNGYTMEIDSALLEDHLTPVPSDGGLPMTVLCFGCSLKEIRWEIRGRDNAEQLAQGQVAEWVENHETAAFTLDLSQAVVQTDREYRLKLTLVTTDGRSIDYYSRVRRMDGLHAAEMVDYVMAFHNATFDKGAATAFTVNMESDGTADDNTLGESSLHSSYQQITWGSLKPQQVGNVSLSILEMDASFGSFKLEFEVAAEDSNGETDRFLATEYVSLQWSEKWTERQFYMMDYRRTVSELMSASDTRLKDKGLELGIQRPEDVEVLEAAGGWTVFRTAGELWSYQPEGRLLNCLFTFRQTDEDPRRYTRNYGIRVLKVSENGDVSFLVYGYMGSGAHEGQTGVSCLTYTRENNTLSEIFFLPYSGSFEDLREGVNTLSCMSAAGDVYLMAGDTVYSVDWEGGEVVVLVDQASRRHLAVNEAQTAIAWDMELQEGESGSVQIFYLDNGESQIVGAESGGWIAPCGFIEEDCVLGVGHKGEAAQAGAVQVHPYYAILIRNRAGEELARYEQEGIRISSVSVSAGQVLMERIRKDETAYVQIESDTLIRNSNPNLQGPELLVRSGDDVKQRVWLLSVPVAAGSGELILAEKAKVSFASGGQWTLPEAETSVRYYGWSEGENVIITDTAGEAVAAVYDKMGAVSDSEGRLVWMRTGRQNTTSLRVADKTGVDVSWSRKECMKQLLASQGLNVAALETLPEELSAMDLMDALFPGAALNLTGAPMRALLYYIDRGTPVLLIDAERRAMLLVGFDPYNVVLFDPVENGRYKMGQNDATAWLEKNTISAIGFLTAQ